MRNVAVTICYPDQHLFATSMEVENTDTDQDILERVFAEWNDGSGKECDDFIKQQLRSLSVNDVVIVNDVYYQCVNIGWNQISEQEFLEIEKAVATHQLRLSRQGGASIALNRVMWNRNMATA